MDLAEFENIRGNARAAMGIIADRLKDYSRKTDSFIAWGQFLDKDADAQVGIYGTGFAAEVFAAENSKILRDQAHESLLELFPDGSLRWTRKSDYSLTIKVASVVRAFGADDPRVKNLVDWLMDAVEPNAGWGYYYFDDAHRDLSDIVPTSIVIEALRVLPDQETRAVVADAVTWSLGATASRPDRDVAEYALVLLAIEALPLGGRFQEAEMNAARSQLQGTVDDWLRAWGPWPENEGPAQFDKYFEVTKDGVESNRYYHIVRDLVVARAGLLPLSSAKSEALRVAIHVSAHCASREGVSRSGRFPTHANYWAYRLLDDVRRTGFNEFVGSLPPEGVGASGEETKDLDDSVPEFEQTPRKKGQVVACALALAVLLGLTALGIWTLMSWPGELSKVGLLWRLGLSVVGAVAGSIAATVVFNCWSGRGVSGDETL